MLYKDKMIPGARLKVRKGPLKDGLPSTFGGGQTVDYITHTATAGSYLSGHRGIMPGSELEVIEKPKRRDGINTAIVKDLTNGGVVGHAYWCELRINCDHIEDPGNLT